MWPGCWLVWEEEERDDGSCISIPLAKQTKKKATFAKCQHRTIAICICLHWVQIKWWHIVFVKCHPRRVTRIAFAFVCSRLFGVKNCRYIFLLLSPPLSKHDAPGAWTWTGHVTQSISSKAKMQKKKVFPWRHIPVYWIVWNTTSLKHKNLMALFEKVFFFLILGASFTICFLLLFAIFFAISRFYRTHGKAVSFSLVTEARHFIQWMRLKMNNYLYLVLMIDGV